MTSPNAIANTLPQAIAPQHDQNSFSPVKSPLQSNPRSLTFPNSSTSQNSSHPNFITLAKSKLTHLCSRFISRCWKGIWRFGGGKVSSNYSSITLFCIMLFIDYCLHILLCLWYCICSVGTFYIEGTYKI